MSDGKSQIQKEARKSGDNVDVGSSEITKMNGNDSAVTATKKRKRNFPKNDVSSLSPVPNQSTNVDFDKTMSAPSTPAPKAKKIGRAHV